MSHKVKVVSDINNDRVILPCGKKNIGDENKRKIFANMHKKRCEICSEMAKKDFKRLYKLEGSFQTSWQSIQNAVGLEQFILRSV